MCTKPTTIPASGPPCSVGLVVLELTRKEDGDENLMDSTLNCDDGYQTQNSVRRIPGLKEPLSLIKVSIELHNR